MNQATNHSQDAKPTTAIPQGGVLALGNFDGVHRGHQALIAVTLDYARQHGIPPRVLTLEPHPRSLFSSPQIPFRLTPPSVKNRLLQAQGIEEVITLEFSLALARQSPRDFVEQMLVQHYHMQHVVAGADFVFGHERAGTMSDMRDWLVPHGIGVTEVPPLRDETGEIISSSRVRAFLYQGDLAAARLLLGRPWAISGIIVPGAERGRILGFPTANINLGDFMRPPFGAYAVMAHRVGDQTLHPGVANIGVRPTVNGEDERLEFHLFRFNGDLYEQEWEVELRHFLRPEHKFPNLEALQDQIMQDVSVARKLLAEPSP